MDQRKPWNRENFLDEIRVSIRPRLPREWHCCFVLLQREVTDTIGNVNRRHVPLSALSSHGKDFQAQPILDKHRRMNHWPATTLSNLFREAVLALGKDRLTCYIDALDECAELEIRTMIGFLRISPSRQENLASTSTSASQVDIFLIFARRTPGSSFSKTKSATKMVSQPIYSIRYKLQSAQSPRLLTKSNENRQASFFGLSSSLKFSTRIAMMVKFTQSRLDYRPSRRSSTDCSRRS
jgi:hypothetical protein